MNAGPERNAMSAWLFTPHELVSKLPDEPGLFRFHYALRHGSMKCGLYAPRSTDTQGPHAQDELYVVLSGSGWFIKNG